MRCVLVLALVACSSAKPVSHGGAVDVMAEPELVVSATRSDYLATSPDGKLVGRARHVRRALHGGDRRTS